MEALSNEPNHLLSLLPLILITIPIVIIVYILAKQKGLNIALWTILACIPSLNFLVILYMVGTTDKKAEAKMNEILTKLDNSKYKG